MFIKSTVLLIVLAACGKTEDEPPVTIIPIDDTGSNQGGDADADSDADADADADSDADTDTDADADTDSDADADADGDADTDADTDQDRDDDGHSADFDCNDNDPTIFPGADDAACDGVDNDCDGWIDSDWDGDDYEPNDLDAYNLGDIDGTIEELTGLFIHPDIDQDIFKFYVEDRWWDGGWTGRFTLEVTLTDVPPTTDLSLRLFWVEDEDGMDRGEVASADDEGRGGDEVLDFNEGLGFSNQTGWYEIIVESTDGSSCSNDYTLIVNGNSR